VVAKTTLVALLAEICALRAAFVVAAAEASVKAVDFRLSIHRITLMAGGSFGFSVVCAIITTWDPSTRPSVDHVNEDRGHADHQTD